MKINKVNDVLHHPDCQLGCLEENGTQQLSPSSQICFKKLGTLLFDEVNRLVTFNRNQGQVNKQKIRGLWRNYVNFEQSMATHGNWSPVFPKGDKRYWICVSGFIQEIKLHMREKDTLTLEDCHFLVKHHCCDWDTNRDVVMSSTAKLPSHPQLKWWTESSCLSMVEMRRCLTGGAWKILALLGPHNAWVKVPYSYLASHACSTVFQGIKTTKLNGIYLGIPSKGGPLVPLDSTWLNSSVTIAGVPLPEHEKDKVREGETLEKKITWEAGAGRKKPGQSNIRNRSAGQMKIAFPQIGTRLTHSCGLCAYASTIHASGLKREAEMVFEEGISLGTDQKGMKHVHALVAKVLKPGHKLKFLKRKSERFYPERSSTAYPIVASLKGNDSYPHVVGFLGNKILDPAVATPLLRNKKNLNDICNGTYRGLHWAVKIVPFEEGKEVPSSEGHQLVKVEASPV